MSVRWRSSINRMLVVAAMLNVAGCARDEVPLAAESTREHDFTGTMVISGSRQVIAFDKDRQAAIFRLGGSTSLAGTNRPAAGFRAEIIGYSDTATGMRGSCVWTDRQGDRVFSELRADEPGPDRPVTGTIVGGTGRFAGVSGEYRFTWQYMMDSDDGTVAARISNLQGLVRFAALPAGASR